MTPDVLDITVAIVLLLSIALGAWRGLVREVFTIVGLAVSALGAWKGGPLLLPYFNDWLGVTGDGGARAAEAVSKGAKEAASSGEVLAAAHSQADLILGIIAPGHLAQACAYGAAFLVVFIIMSLISFFVSRSIEEMGFGIADRLGGAAFGGARGFLLVFIPFLVCFVVAGSGTEKFPDWAKNSRTVPVLEDSYAFADTNLGLSKYIKEFGDMLVVKIDKGKDKIKSTAEQELQDALDREEAEREPPPPPPLPMGEERKE